MTNTDAATRTRAGGALLRAALAAILALACLQATSQRAYAAAPTSAPDFTVHDSHGNVIGNGSAVDVNALMGGISIHYVETQENEMGPSTSLICVETGETVPLAQLGGTWDGASWTANLGISGSIVPGYTYTFNIAWGWFDTSTNPPTYPTYAWSSITFTASGGDGGGGGDTEGGGSDTGGGGGGDGTDDGTSPDDGTGGGTGGGDADQNPEQPDDSTGGASGSTSDETSSDTSTVSPDAPTDTGDVDTVSAREALGGEADSEVSSNAEDGSSSIEGSDLSSLAKGASSALGNVSASQLASMGRVYGIAGSAAGADGDAAETQNALALNIVGLPYLWALVWALILGAAPFAVVRRAGSFKWGTARRRTRLG